MRTWVLEGATVRDLLADRVLTHGLGVFETMLAVEGRLIRPDLHFRRLAAGCARLGISGIDETSVLAELARVLGGMREVRVRVRVMRSAGSGGLSELAGQGPRTILSVAGLPPVPESVTVATAPWPRHEASPLVGVKCASYAENLFALDHARRSGVDELIFSNTRGLLCEAATANVFVVADGRLATPPVSSGCLPGTARQRVIELAAGLGIGVVERELPLDEARGADEIFLTSATRGVVRVSRWDRHELARRFVTDRLRQAFDDTLRG